MEQGDQGTTPGHLGVCVPTDEMDLDSVRGLSEMGKGGEGRGFFFNLVTTHTHTSFFSFTKFSLHFSLITQCQKVGGKNILFFFLFFRKDK